MPFDVLNCWFHLQARLLLAEWTTTLGQGFVLSAERFRVARRSGLVDDSFADWTIEFCDGADRKERCSSHIAPWTWETLAKRHDYQRERIPEFLGQLLGLNASSPVVEKTAGTTAIDESAIGFPMWSRPF